LSGTDLTAGDRESQSPEGDELPLAPDLRLSFIEVERQQSRIRPEVRPLSIDSGSGQGSPGFWRRHRLFIVTVVLPMTIGVGLLHFVVTPRYGSTASFIVRTIDPPSPQELTAHIEAGVQSTIANDETNAILAYLNSRDIVDLLENNDDLRGILGRSQADFIFRYPTFWLPDNEEFLYRRFKWLVKAEADPESLIITVDANAFSPRDAQAIVQALLRYAEARVNRLNERYYHDEVALADRYIVDAQKNFDVVEAELKRFRNATGSVDPTLVAQEELNVVQALTTQLAQGEATIAQQLAMAPRSPVLGGLRAATQSYRDEIEKRNRAIAGAPGSEASKLETYDLLTLRQTLAVQALTDAVTQRDQARQDAQRRHVFLQLVTQPSLSLDWAQYPQTAWDLSWLLAFCLALFQVLSRLRNCALEHIA
jgi:capsular polysaccharide transport system permease protein